MTQSHSPRAIIEIKTDRPDLLGFEIIDKIAQSDMEWMADLIDYAFESQDRIDLILIMTNFQGVEASALMSADAAGVSLKSLRHVRKYCVVGAPGWARAMIETFRWLTPVEEKTFELHEAAAAWHWVEEGRESLNEANLDTRAPVEF